MRRRSLLNKISSGGISPIDISTLSNPIESNISVGSGDLRSLQILNSNSRIFCSSGTTDRVYGLDITSGDVTTLSNETSSTFTSTILLGFYITEDGTKLYAPRYANGTIYEYDLPTPFSFTGKSLNQTVSGFASRVVSISLSPDGTTLYILHNSGDNIYEYDLSTPFDISTKTYTGVSSGVFGGISSEIRWSFDGLNFCVCRQDTNEINQYSVTTAWTTLDGYSLENTAGFGYPPVGVDFDYVNRKMYVLNNTTRKIIMYDVD